MRHHRNAAVTVLIALTIVGGCAVSPDEAPRN
ncbi:MAG: hypothetical protein RLZZ362_1030, partial [Actinomycetota bacterium]